MADVTLVDGTVVSSSDRRWLEECLQRHRHVESMRGIGRQGRVDYLETVRAKEGEEAARRLREAFLIDWEKRHAER